MPKWLAPTIAILILIPASAAAQSLPRDTDQDGLTDEEEMTRYQTDYTNADTDNDGYTDGEEKNNGFSPRHPKMKLTETDSDEDGLVDAWEIKLGSDILNKDTDGDGYGDGDEVRMSYSPTDAWPTKVQKRIEIDIASFTLKYFHGDVLLDSIPVSTGRPGFNTPKGEFKVLAKVPVKSYGGRGYNFYYPNTKWNLHFTTGSLRYYIHGAYWHNLFGKKNVSSGCVNVNYADMERLYNWADTGAKVSVK